MITHFYEKSKSREEVLHFDLQRNGLLPTIYIIIIIIFTWFILRF